MRNILIIAQELLTRAYIGAQLQEEGFDIVGSSDIPRAVQQIKEWGVTPDLVIIDTLEQSLSQEAVDILNELYPIAILLVIHGTWDFPLSINWQAEKYELLKPVTIGEITNKVKELMDRQQNGSSH